MTTSSLRVGCASWLDRSLIREKTFYPPASLSAEDRLRWYADFFPFVEVNATYYSLLTPDVAALWAKRSPPGFAFGVKAWGPMTGHAARPGCLPAEFRARLKDAPRTPRGEVPARAFGLPLLERSFELFRAALEPLRREGKLAYALFQFAPWMEHSPAALTYLRALPRRLPGVPVAVEFRHPSWIPRRTPAALAALRDAGLAHVAADCPWMPRVCEATTDLFVLRCHGRNAEGWKAQLRGESPSVEQKYDYVYSDAEIAELAAAFAGAAGKPKKSFLVFNNNCRDYPVVNALAASRRLGGNPPEVEARLAAWKRRKRPQTELSF